MSRVVFCCPLGLDSRGPITEACTSNARWILHRVLDVTFRQDDCRIRNGNAAANFATINTAAINLLRRGPGKISLPQKRRSAAWDDDYMEAVIRQ